jgi:hypothetical protein
MFIIPDTELSIKGRRVEKQKRRKGNMGRKTHRDSRDTVSFSYLLVISSCSCLMEQKRALRYRPNQELSLKGII